MNFSPIGVIISGLATVALASAAGAAPADSGTSRQAVQLQVPGAESQKITITYDGIGTPHIEASSEAAGYTGLCYAIAKDRLFQMEIFRRSAQGRLSELFGAGPDDVILGQDKLFRALGLVANAKDHLATSSAHTKSILVACAAGVEQFRKEIADGRSPLPREFADLGGFIPEPWAAEDSMLIAVYLQTALDMPTWQAKLTTAALTQVVGADVTSALVPLAQGGSMFDAQGKLNPPDGGPATQTRGHGDVPQALRRVRPEDAAKALKLPQAPMGPNLNGWRASNNFAVDGHRTATGKPIIANDPHLMLSMPGMFYQAELKVNDSIDVAGFLIPGVPAFLIGHNTDVSWAITYGMIDTVDVYLETVQGHSVQYLDKPVPLRTRVEWFYPAGGAPVSINIDSTPHGPLLNGAAPAFDAFGALALKSTVAQPEWTVNGWFDIVTAKNWGTFSKALEQESVGLNYLFGDSKGRFGHIGYQLTGLAPQRPLANSLMPVRGDDGSGEWRRYARYDELPSVFDPPAHALVTSNHRIVPDNYAPKGEPLYLSRYWDEPWRAQRALGLLLNAPAPLTADAVAQVQLDQTHFAGQPLARRLADILARTGLPANDADAAYSLGLLNSFNGNLAADSASAAVFEALTTLLVRDVAQGAIGPELYPTYAQTVFFTTELHALIDLLDHPRAPFFGATSPADAEAARDLAVQNALAEADGLLRHSLGADHSAWTWGGLHTLTYNHPFASFDPAFALPTFPTGGDPATVNTGGWFTAIGRLALPESQLDALGGAQAAFAQEGLASARVVMDSADFQHSLWVNSTGSSGDPLSPYWADQAAAWRAGTYFQVPFQ